MPHPLARLRVTSTGLPSSVPVTWASSGPPYCMLQTRAGSSAVRSASRSRLIAAGSHGLSPPQLSASVTRSGRARVTSTASRVVAADPPAGVDASRSASAPQPASAAASSRIDPRGRRRIPLLRASGAGVTASATLVGVTAADAHDVLRALRGGPATLDALHARLGGPARDALTWALD